MKHIKTYESIKYRKPILEIGTYVICDENNVGVLLKKFLSNNVGQITNNYYSEQHPYIVKYENIPSEIEGRFNEVKDFITGSTYKDRRMMTEDEIIRSSKDKETLESFIKAKKYNI